MISTKALIVSILSGSAAASPFFGSVKASPQCVSGSAVHIIIARGTTEPQGPGLQGIVANAIVAKLPGSTIESVVYPASFDLPSSVNEGIANMTKQAIAYNSACPNSKLVFMGYSQGAQIVGDVVGGGGSVTPNGSKTNPTPPIGSTVMSKVVSIVLFGDPNRQAGFAYDKLTCTVDATHPRSGAQAATFNQYASYVQDYCDAQDPVCCGTGMNILAHLGYFNNDNSQAIANFVYAKATSS